MVRLKIDMHVHTHYSDSTGSVEEVIETAKKKGLDGIAITDHHTLEGAKLAKRTHKNLIIIPGEEVKTDKSEILAFGINQLIPKDLPIEEAVRKVHSQNGLVFIPHPTVPLFGKLRKLNVHNLHVDGLEVFSAITPLPFHYALENIAIAKRLGVSMIAGSDSHFPETVGDAYTIIESRDRSLPSILEAMRLGRTKIFCRSSRLKYKIKMLRCMINYLFEKE